MNPVADGCLLKLSLLFVAGLTLGIAIAKATAVAKIRIKQFWTISSAGKAVAPCPVMAMPLFLFLCEVLTPTVKPWMPQTSLALSWSQLFIQNRTFSLAIPELKPVSSKA